MKTTSWKNVFKLKINTLYNKLISCFTQSLKYEQVPNFSKTNIIDRQYVWETIYQWSLIYKKDQSLIKKSKTSISQYLWGFTGVSYNRV